MGAGRSLGELGERVSYLKKAQAETPAADESMATDVRALETRLADLRKQLNGDRTRARRAEPTLPSISRRVGRAVGAQWSSTSAPTETNREAYRIAGEAFKTFLAELQQFATDVEKLEVRMEKAGAPWTPGRIPTWSME